jgi:hypothetical protein
MVPELVTDTLSVARWPTLTVPKFSDAGLSVSEAAVDVPKRLMNSNEVPESDRICNVPERTVEVEAAVGVNSKTKLQAAPGSRVEHVLVDTKSVETVVERTWIAVVPVFVSTTVCASDILPICVLAKVRAFSDRMKELRIAEVAGSLETTGITEPPIGRISGLEIASLSIVKTLSSKRGVAVELLSTSSIGAYVSVTLQLILGGSVEPQLLID